MQQWPKALCSDAYSGWVAGDRNAKKLNNEVLRATKSLYEEVIPKVADEMVSDEGCSSLSGSDLITFIHEYDIFRITCLHCVQEGIELSPSWMSQVCSTKR